MGSEGTDPCILNLVTVRVGSSVWLLASFTAGILVIP